MLKIDPLTGNVVTAGGDGGGVTVPGDILPAQAFADNILKFTTGAAVDVSGQSITYIEPALLSRSVEVQSAKNGGSCSLDLRTNSLSTSNIGSILSAVGSASAPSGVTSGTLELSGANMGTPVTVPAIDHVDASVVLDLNGVDALAIIAGDISVSGGVITYGFGMVITFNPSLPPASSNDGSGAGFVIGLQGMTAEFYSVQDLVDAFVLLNGSNAGVAGVSDAGGGKIRISFADELNYGSLFVGLDGGITQFGPLVQGTVAVAATINADLQSLIDTGFWHGSYTGEAGSFVTF